MNYSLIISSLITFTVAIIIFLYGLKVNKRKVVVLKANKTLLINFMVIIWVMVIFLNIQSSTQKYSWSLKHLIIIGLIILLGLILYKASSINLNVYNSSKEVIYEALEGILSKYGVAYELKKSNILIANSKLKIKVWYNKGSKSCTVSLSDIKYPEVISKVFEDFRNQLNNQESKVKSSFGLIFIFLSIVIFVLGALILVLWLLLGGWL